MVERSHTKRCSDYPKSDLPHFHKCLDKGIHAVLSVASLSKRLDAYVRLLNRADSKAVPIMAVRKREVPMMNEQLKQLVQTQ